MEELRCQCESQLPTTQHLKTAADTSSPTKRQATAPCSQLPTGTGFPSAPFKECSVTTRGLKYLLWVWLQSARGPREVHSISWDPWCTWKAHPNSTLLASPLQVKQGPDLLFCLILLTRHVFLTTAGKGDQLWHMRSSDTKGFTAMFKHLIL